ILPAEIVKLTKLTDLHLSSNQLTILPAEIGKLTNLITLHVPFNQIPTEEQEKIKKLLPNCEINF
ncbi:MAG: hypothetical protein LH618_03995, partial [Saprospiraceae bacterium]|nr:hypothetical protein [Saprospiraceae bacterium]